LWFGGLAETGGKPFSYQRIEQGEH